jgi:hypothetical protein
VILDIKEKYRQILLTFEYTKESTNFVFHTQFIQFNLTNHTSVYFDLGNEKKIIIKPMSFKKYLANE